LGLTLIHVFNAYWDQKEKGEQNLDPTVYAELRYAIDHELAYKPVDFFIRRTGALFFDINWVRTYKNPVIRFMKKELVWSQEQEDAYTKELEQVMYEATNPIEKE
jgi:glycerol-3-phosphate dehydrogenase